MNTYIRLIMSILLLFASSDSALADSFAWTVTGSGGGQASSANYTIQSTAGQAVIGTANSAGNGLGAGYWYGIGQIASGKNPIAICGPDNLKCENAGIKVQFNGTASYDPDGTISSYYWEFGDGGNGTGVAPNHTYSAYRWNGSAYQPFMVNLTATDASSLTNKTSQKVVIGIAGDANGDGNVNILDASVVGLKWNGNDPCADLNNDGKVNILDASIIGFNWGKIA